MVILVSSFSKMLHIYSVSPALILRFVTSCLFLSILFFNSASSLVSLKLFFKSIPTVSWSSVRSFWILANLCSPASREEGSSTSSDEEVITCVSLQKQPSFFAPNRSSCFRRLYTGTLVFWRNFLFLQVTFGSLRRIHFGHWLKSWFVQIESKKHWILHFRN